MERALLQTIRLGEQVKLVVQYPDLVTLKKSKDKLDRLKAKWNIWVKLRYEVSGSG